MPTTNILDLNNRLEQLEKSGGGSGGGGAADDVTYDSTASGLQATNVQDAIDEVSGEISGLSADDVTYDNTDSGLSSETVQGAIDETVNKIDTLTAEDVGYDNTTSGLAATTVQGAIDEVVSSSSLGIKKIAETTNESMTFSSKIDSLYSAYSQLSQDERAKAVLKLPYTSPVWVYNIDLGVSKFSCTSILKTNVMCDYIELRQTGSIIKESNNGSVSDISSTTVTHVVELYVLI